jgi:hypothetical protein
MGPDERARALLGDLRRQGLAVHDAEVRRSGRRCELKLWIEPADVNEAQRLGSARGFVLRGKDGDAYTFRTEVRPAEESGLI